MASGNNNRDPVTGVIVAPAVVAVCGATGGIGESLAKFYSTPGNRLLLAGRRLDKLNELKLYAEAHGAEAEVLAFDLRDRLSMEKWAKSVVREGASKIILCSGVSASVQFFQSVGDDIYYLPENQTDLVRELEVNAVGNIFLANTIVREELIRIANVPEIPHRHMQIALISSLAALTGLPGSPGYSASKAAVGTFGEALGRLIEDRDIGITVFYPGFVESEMSRRYQGAKPFMISAERAAELIDAAIEKRRRKFAFPAVLAMGIRLLNWLPTGLQRIFLKSFFFTVEPDQESRNRN